jgi:putative hydrolase of the HAD superfamily
MIIYTDEAGRDSWKPSPWGYQKMMTHFNLQGMQCAYVGDNSLKDFTGAKALGWGTVKVVRSDGLYKNVPIVSENDADYSISTLTELKKLI